VGATAGIDLRSAFGVDVLLSLVARKIGELGRGEVADVGGVTAATFVVVLVLGQPVPVVTPLSAGLHCEALFGEQLTAF